MGKIKQWTTKTKSSIQCATCVMLKQRPSAGKVKISSRVTGRVGSQWKVSEARLEGLSISPHSLPPPSSKLYSFHLLPGILIDSHVCFYCLLLLSSQEARVAFLKCKPHATPLFSNFLIVLSIQFKILNLAYKEGFTSQDSLYLCSLIRAPFPSMIYPGL